jgi:UPF0271 protein
VVDLNLDAGERVEALEDGSEAQFYSLVSSVNIACGGHAGDEISMALSVDLAKKFNVKVGAHPSFPDRENFGRIAMKMSHAELVESLAGQIHTLQIICNAKKVDLHHVKPHGALYNLASQDSNIATAIFEALRRFDPCPILVGLADSPFLKAAKASRFDTLAEGFVDRRYEANGTLRSRIHSDALIKDPAECARQALRLIENGGVETLCIHGDEPGALATAKAVKEALLAAGHQIGAL